ncbi:BQ5605_C013g07289 [Microbotryum silenes-dioicae]|uniref:BQ5605_C013g07289 protein n=1 Tax=Microbotryum silenes-dioicae TaxID=796604 RepID=A0A2X0LW00_9BASI|nr:BQ5605_C013g07289 [Microbotryum silenes-dioicae]
MSSTSILRQPRGSLTPYTENQWVRGIPSPYYNESHEKLRLAARAWTEEHLMDVGFEWEENREIDHSVYQQLAKDGLLVCLAFGTKIPKKWANAKGEVFGGIKVEQWDGFHDAILIDEMLRCGSLGAVQGLMGGLQIGLPPVFHYGSQELQDRILPDVFSGKKRICLAITEPEAGSDVKNLSTSAKLSSDGKHFIVNGVKKWITNGIYSDYFTALVRTSGKAGQQAGISFLLIPNGPGVTRRKMLMSGQWCAGTTYMTFEDVKVPVENLIGAKDQGFKLAMQNFNHERLMIVYNSHRLARVCLEDSINYAIKRKVFGKALIESEVIRLKIAHMAREVDAMQTWIESIVYAVDTMPHDEANAQLGGTTAMLKAHASLVLEIVAREAVQILGGIGITRGGVGERIERVRRDVKGIAIPGGSEEVMLMQSSKVAIQRFQVALKAAEQNQAKL